MINLNKIIYKAISQGYDGDPQKTNLLQIQDWVIRKYNLIPTYVWDSKNKCWKSYVYDIEYDSIDWLAKIKAKTEMSSKEATQALNKYIQANCVVKDINGNDKFYNGEQALGLAIEKAMAKGLKST